jgi:hypothetical protein
MYDFFGTGNYARPSTKTRECYPKTQKRAKD